VSIRTAIASAWGWITRRSPEVRDARAMFSAMSSGDLSMVVGLVRAYIARNARPERSARAEAWAGIVNRTVGVHLRWTPADRERVLSQCEAGDLYALGLFLDAMHADGTVWGIMRTRGALLRLPIQYRGDPLLTEWLRGADPVFDSTTGDLVRPGHESDFARMFPMSELGAILWDGDLGGLGIGEFVPDENGQPRLRHLDVHWLRYDWSLQAYVYASPFETYIVRPGDGRWFLYAPYGMRRPWSRAPWLPCALPVIAKQHAVLDRMRWQGDLADALKLIQLDKDRVDVEGENMRRFARDDWKRSPHLVLRTDEKASLVESSGRGFEVYTQAEHSADIEIARTLAGQTATSGDGAGGLGNKGDVWSDIQASITGESAEQLAAAIHDQALKPYARARRRAPYIWIKWDCRSPQQRAADAKALADHADGIAKANDVYRAYGQRVDLEAFDEQQGFVVPRQPLAGAPSPKMLAHATEATAGAAGFETRFVSGLPLVIDRPKGTVQRGVGPDGPWERTFLVDYGCIDRELAPEFPLSADGEGLDVYDGAETPDDPGASAVVVEQLRRDGSFDELKILVRFRSVPRALTTFLEHVPTWALGRVTVVPIAELAAWVAGRAHEAAERPVE
jgi:hypothetical protein